MGITNNAEFFYCFKFVYADLKNAPINFEFFFTSSFDNFLSIGAFFTDGIKEFEISIKNICVFLYAPEFFCRTFFGSYEHFLRTLIENAQKTYISNILFASIYNSPFDSN
jgi:hypothetical protein